MFITSFDVNVEVLNISSEIIIIIITWIISSSTVLAGCIKKPEGSALYMLPIIAIMNWHFLFSGSIVIYTVSQEECARLREGVPYVKVYQYNPKRLCPKLNGYGDNGQRKVWSSGGSTHCTCQLTALCMLRR